MTVIQIIILCVVLLVCTISVLLFYFQNKKDQQLHTQTVGLYTEQIIKNKAQLQLRNVYLNRYDFVKQNLNEALRVQQEIDIGL